MPWNFDLISFPQPLFHPTALHPPAPSLHCCLRPSSTSTAPLSPPLYPEYSTQALTSKTTPPHPRLSSPPPSAAYLPTSSAAEPNSCGGTTSAYSPAPPRGRKARNTPSSCGRRLRTPLPYLGVGRRCMGGWRRIAAVRTCGLTRCRISCLGRRTSWDTLCRRGRWSRWLCRRRGSRRR